MRAFVAFVLALFLAPVVRADTGHVHVVRSGETLASIAQLYYGDPRREGVLVAENGLASQGGAPIVTGMQLRIPWVRYHRVAEGETWSQLAERFYGESRRAFVIQEANRAGNDPPAVGAQLLIPYPLRHVVGQGDTVVRLARQYYGRGNAAVRRLRRFNGLRGNRIARGGLILVPIADLTLSDEGRQRVEAALGVELPRGEVREAQAAIDEALPRLDEHVAEGRFAEALSLGNRLLGSRDLTAIQRVAIERRLAVAYVAVDRPDLARAAFLEALRRQPTLELDSVRTSPRVLEAYEAARNALAAESDEADDEPADAAE